MGPEKLYDISSETKNQILNQWRQVVGNPVEYIGDRLHAYSNAPSIRPLWEKLIQSAYGSRDDTVIRLLGSIVALDGVVFDHKRAETWLEITSVDMDRYGRFCDEFLTDPRWRGLTEKIGGIELVKAHRTDDYLKLIQNDVPNRVDISPLLEVLSAGQTHQLAELIRVGAQILVDDNLRHIHSAEDEAEVRGTFERGGWPVLAALVVKHGGEHLNRLLLEQRFKNRSS